MATFSQHAPYFLNLVLFIIEFYTYLVTLNILFFSEAIDSFLDFFNLSLPILLRWVYSHRYNRISDDISILNISLIFAYRLTNLLLTLKKLIQPELATGFLQGFWVALANIVINVVILIVLQMNDMKCCKSNYISSNRVMIFCTLNDFVTSCCNFLFNGAVLLGVLHTDFQLRYLPLLANLAISVVIIGYSMYLFFIPIRLKVSEGVRPLIATCVHGVSYRDCHEGCSDAETQPLRGVTVSSCSSGQMQSYQSTGSCGGSASCGSSSSSASSCGSSSSSASSCGSSKSACGSKCD